MQTDKFFATKSNKRLHRWGFNDSGFELTGEKTVTFSGNRYEVSGTTMPDFIPYIESVLGIDFDKEDQISPIDTKPTQPSSLDHEFFQQIKNSFNEDRYTVDDLERLIHSHGQETFKDVYKVLYDSIERNVDLVFYPETEEEVSKLVALAVKFNVCIIPYGGGTNVTRALTIPENEKKIRYFNGYAKNVKD